MSTCYDDCCNEPHRSRRYCRGRNCCEDSCSDSGRFYDPNQDICVDTLPTLQTSDMSVFTVGSSTGYVTVDSVKPTHLYSSGSISSSPSGALLRLLPATISSIATSVSSTHKTTTLNTRLTLATSFQFQVSSTASVQKQTNTRVTDVPKSPSSSSIVKQKSTVGLPKGHGGPGQLKGREESNGAIIGGAVGASVAVILLCAIIAFFILFRRKKSRKHDKDDQNKAAPISELKKMPKGTSMKSSNIYEQPYDAPWNSLQVPYIIAGSPKSLTPSPTLSTSPLYEGSIDTPEIYRTIYGDTDRYSYINPSDVLEHESGITTPAYCYTTTDEIVQREKLEFPENFRDDTYDVVDSSIRDDSYDVVTSSIKSSSLQREPTYISTDAIVERKRISRAENSKNVAKELEKMNRPEKCQSDINENFGDSTEQPDYMILEKEQPGVEENFYDIAAS